MRFGVCAKFEQLDIARESGCDYMEPSVAELMSLTGERYREIKKQIDDSPIKCEAFNVMLPGTHKVTGPDADIRKAVIYMEEALSKMDALGGQVVVFGSSGARNYPEGFEKKEAFEQLVEFLSRLDSILQSHEILLAIEPLNPGESNIINLVSEAWDLAMRTNSHSISCLADWYHMALQNESTEGIWRAGSRLTHIHISNPDGRIYPKVDDGQDYHKLADALKEIGYKRRVSIEASTTDMRTELPAAIAYVRSVFG